LTSTATPQAAAPISIPRLLSVILSARFIINIMFRAAYAFVPQFSRGLGVDLQTMSALMSARASVGLLAPVFGPLSDRFGRRIVMLGGLALFVLCALIAFASSSFIPFAVGFIGLALAKVIFDPSASAYLGDRVPYAQRGLVLGIGELGWAASGFVGVPLAGWAIDRWGWQSPFAGVALGGVIVWLWAAWALPRAEPTSHVIHPNFRAAFTTILRHRSAVFMLCAVALFTIASDLIAITYATWLEQKFNVDTLTLGSITATFGVADVIGELLSMWGVDRFGKKRALLVGFISTAFCYVTLPLVEASLSSAVVALFVFYTCFEFAIVSVYPLVSELTPEARATMLSLTALASNVGRTIGSRGGAALFAVSGFGANSIAAAMLVGVAVGMLVWGVREKHA
jgi:predicted MFS family arabinose efflux permease